MSAHHLSTRTDFFDPVHGFLDLDRMLDHPDDAELREIVRGVIGSYEFCRHSYVRQSSFSFLRFPSATHTRFAHSIGAFSLGPLAGRLVQVASANGCPTSLEDCLRHNGVWREFLLAILLHDVGHFCFSHTLESNHRLWRRFPDMPHEHEDVGCDLVRGSGEKSLHAEALRQGRSRAGLEDEVPLLSEVLSCLPQTSLSTICYFITGDEDHLRTGMPCATAVRQMCLELVSGLLDLDRLDHYPRDAVFFFGPATGVGIDIACLLGGLTCAWDTRRPLRLRSSAAAGQVIRLLQLRERLNQDCFDSRHTLGVEAMFNEAFDRHTRWLACDEAALAALLMRSDDDVLAAMRESGDPVVRYLTSRIACRRPYPLVARAPFMISKQQPIDALAVEDWARKYFKIDDHRLVLRFSKGFSSKAPSGDDHRMTDLDSGWLALERLEFDFPEKQRHNQSVSYFKALQQRRVADAWVFCDGPVDERLVQGFKDAVTREWGDLAAFDLEKLPLG